MLSSQCRGVQVLYPDLYFTIGHGSSRNPADENYCGPAPLSEPCVVNMRNFLLKYKSTICAYLSLHTFGRVWCYPDGGTPEQPADIQDLVRIRINT